MPAPSTPRPARRLVLLLTVPALVAGVAALPSGAATPAPHAGPLAVPAYSSFNVLDSGAPVQVRTLSTRPELVTGGDVLVEVVVPQGTRLSTVRVTAAGRDMTRDFRPAGPGLRGMVRRLPAGRSTLTATVPGTGSASLAVSNVGLQAPSFSGPLITPWTCNNGATRADCSKNATISYVYKSTDPSKAGLPGRVASDPVQSPFQPYDPAAPPSDVATTTTDDGRTVPFVVRVEEGYSLRDQYRIAALFDPATQGVTPNPLAANPGFNHKLVLAHGTSCDTSYESGTATDVLFEEALAQGFAVASHALDNAGHNCNLVTQAESLIRTKEMVVERFGPLRFTIGSGCSGGSLVQQQVANAYPGVYQGITPQCSFTDAWSSAQQYVDYVGLRAYLEGEGAAESGIVPAQWPSIFGHANPANQITFTEAIPNSGDPSRSCPGVPDEKVFTTASQKGVRCTFQDYMKNVFGVDAKGKAHRPISNVGIQYGLSGLLTSLGANVGDVTRPPLTAAQFVALNANVGGYDLDFEHTAARTQGDPVAQDRVYRSGAVDTAAHLDRVAIIDLGGPEPGAFHDVYRKFALRDRLVREHGTSANQVFWQGQTPLLGDVQFAESAITAMDTWLQQVEKDKRPVPLPTKIIDAKGPARIAERCVGTEGVDLPVQQCRAAVGATLFSSPRIEAGGGDTAPVNGVGPKTVGFTDDRLDCQTMPIERFVYAGKKFTEVFDAAQQATLKKTFPTGVCDYSKPGKGFQDATTWLTYQDATGKVVYGGRPLGNPPGSTFRR